MTKTFIYRVVLISAFAAVGIFSGINAGYGFNSVTASPKDFLFAVGMTVISSIAFAALAFTARVVK